MIFVTCCFEKHSNSGISFFSLFLFWCTNNTRDIFFWWRIVTVLLLVLKSLVIQLVWNEVFKIEASVAESELDKMVRLAFFWSVIMSWGKTQCWCSPPAIGTRLGDTKHESWQGYSNGFLQVIGLDWTEESKHSVMPNIKLSFKSTSVKTKDYLPIHEPTPCLP